MVSNEQVWVSALGCGPQGTPVRMVWQNASSLSVQDEVGTHYVIGAR